jgi:hypothetical protein
MDVFRDAEEEFEILKDDAGTATADDRNSTLSSSMAGPTWTSASVTFEPREPLARNLVSTELGCAARGTTAGLGRNRCSAPPTLDHHEWPVTSEQSGEDCADTHSVR